MNGLPGCEAHGQDTPEGRVASLLQFLVSISPFVELGVKELDAAVVLGVTTLFLFMTRGRLTKRRAG